MRGFYFNNFKELIIIDIVLDWICRLLDTLYPWFELFVLTGTL